MKGDGRTQIQAWGSSFQTLQKYKFLGYILGGYGQDEMDQNLPRS